MTNIKKYTAIVLVAFLLVLSPILSESIDPQFDTKLALVKIFKNEGGFSLDKNDSGNWTGGKVGKGTLVGTNYGMAGSIYYKYFQVRKKTMKQTTLADAALIYERDYARPLRLAEIKSQWLGTMFLDTAINCGQGMSAILISRTINVLNGAGEDFPVDPVMTKSKIDWINEYTKNRWTVTEKDSTRRYLFGSVFKEMRARRYVQIVRFNKAKLRYLPTWLERTYEF
jgi:lysozyme family protein